jgi:hypothetical protein
VPAAGVEGNEKLTAWTGALLLVGFAIEGFTILSVQRLLFLHFLVGLLLIGPVLLKIGSTVYRFGRYYSGSAPYVRKGPPSPALRVLGPLVILTSVAVIGTGTVIAVIGRNATWLFLHKASFVLWFGVMTIHVLAYAWRLPRIVGGDLRGRGYRARQVLAGRRARWLLLTASVLTGVLLGVLILHQTAAWSGPHAVLGG